MSPTGQVRPRVIPHLWYADQPGAIDFLQHALGFTVHFTAPEPGGGVHAELRVGRGFIMVGPRHSPRHGFRTPAEIGGTNTGVVYIAADDVEARCERARQAGAEIVAPLHDTDWSSRDFTLRDPEGYLWHLGTYHPGAEGQATPREAGVFDALRYADAPTAINWLGRAFGLSAEFVNREGGRIGHALLSLGDDLLIVSSTREGGGLQLAPPEAAGGFHTQVVYCVVDDPAEHHARAVATGADILVAPTAMPWGAFLYQARDPEGYVWCFSTYGPHAADRPA